MKAIMKAALLGCCIPLLFVTSCEDKALDLEYVGYESVLYLGNVGEVPIEFYNVNKDIRYTTFIGKGGTETTIQRDATLRVWTQDELQAYNEANGTDYHLLPEGYYSLPTDFSLSTTQEKQPVEVILKKEVGTVDRTKEYVLPLELTSTAYAVNAKASRLLLRPRIITPMLSFERTGKRDPISMSIKDNKVTTVDFKTSLMVNMQNQGWSFGVDFETDESKLNTLLDQYQSTTSGGPTYKLLPKANYNMTQLQFGGTDNKKEWTIGIDRKGLSVGHYLLPLALKGIAGMPFDVSSDVVYVHLEVNDRVPQIMLTSSQISANSTDGNTVPSLINGIFNDDGWQSQWYNASISKPISDPKYGIYVDIKNISIDALAKLALTIKTTHNNPKHIQIYAGSSESDLKLIHENTNAFPNSATNKRYETGDLAVSNIKMIRIALITNVGNYDMRNLQFYSGNYIQNVSLSEIELFGL